jgi:hypothetical protein
MKKLTLLFLWLPLNLWAQNNSLTLYFAPSPVGMDWSSPANLAWSALKNRLSMKSRFMGHVFVEFQCGKERELTGMVGKNFDYLNQLLIESRGLGILYHSFEGKLEDKKDLDQELPKHLKDGRVNFARFLLNNGQCQRLTNYLKEYRAQNVGRYYGLANRPLYGEGAGCSAFGASFLDVAGIMDTEMKETWSNSVNIPMEFAGPPIKDERVSLFKVMFGAKKWAREEEPHRKLMFWDPDRMFKWVNDKVKKATPNNGYSVLKIDQSVGVVFDKSHLPVPQSPIWKKTAAK